MERLWTAGAAISSFGAGAIAFVENYNIAGLIASCAGAVLTVAMALDWFEKARAKRIENNEKKFKLKKQREDEARR